MSNVVRLLTKEVYEVLEQRIGMREALKIVAYDLQGLADKMVIPEDADEVSLISRYLLKLSA